MDMKTMGDVGYRMSVWSRAVCWLLVVNYHKSMTWTWYIQPPIQVRQHKKTTYLWSLVPGVWCAWVVGCKRMGPRGRLLLEYT